MSRKTLSAVFIALFAASNTTYAAHPLITDDTGTQGKGKTQFEAIGEYGYEKKDGVTTDSFVAPTIPVLSYGMTDASDIVFGVSYQRIKVTDSQKRIATDGISDTSIEIKWRFAENDGLSFAMKPGITLPTGNDEKGLGGGKITYHMVFITTKEIKPWAFHMNLAYIRNENKIDERIDLWQASIAGVVDVLKNLKAVANIGMERDRDKASDATPGFFLGGFIYSVSENLDFDIGFKEGFNNHGIDYSIPAGITWRY